jgi:hypothetical protein
MMKAVILVCALSMSRPDCSVDTAASVIQGPEANTLAQCGHLGHAYPASVELAAYLNGENYFKILCTGDNYYGVEMDRLELGRR